MVVRLGAMEILFSKQVRRINWIPRLVEMRYILLELLKIQLQNNVRIVYIVKLLLL